MLSGYSRTWSRSAWIGEIVGAGVQVELEAAAETEPESCNNPYLTRKTAPGQLETRESLA